MATGISMVEIVVELFSIVLLLIYLQHNKYAAT